MLLNAVGVYILVVTLGGVAFRLCWREPVDPADMGVFLVFLLTPLPGLMAFLRFALAVRERVAHAHGPLFAGAGT